RPRIARLLASVPPETKTISFCFAPISEATSRRARSTAARACWPKVCTLDALPKVSDRLRTITDTTRSSIGVVALWSRYTFLLAPNVIYLIMQTHGQILHLSGSSVAFDRCS